MKTIVVAAVLGLLGCGGGGAPITMGAAGSAGTSSLPPPENVTWAMSFNAASWYCRGPMAVHVIHERGRDRLSGSWNCSGIDAINAQPVTMGGAFTGLVDLVTDEVAMVFESTDGNIPIDASFGGTSIVGTAHFRGADVPFEAH